ncbi:hypothetical protein [Acinetobacter sp. ANC 4178]|uniref:hypothetical protein n=1 Tax=Acinetobacter sp. ANC 4178 TaxID=2529839 RepID=UPI00103F7017|nr:hypothetical protein [Acinetobacter sp. ANC 4178]TCB68684.1 hypothetical protein E0H87_01720 [Acinetobacter sp. ANC 4178]
MSDLAIGVRTVKDNNDEILNKLFNEAHGVYDYLNKLKNGELVSDDAIETFKKYNELLGFVLDETIKSAKNLILLIQNIDTNQCNISYMQSVSFPLEVIKKEYNSKNINEIQDDLYNTMGILKAIYGFIDSYRVDGERYNKILSSRIVEILDDAKKDLEEFRLTKNILQNIRTQDYYEKESIAFFNKAKNNRNIFIGLIVVALGVAITSVVAEPRFFMDAFDYWFLKISYILVSITLITYFLKQSTHYQRLGDQANQTSLEIKAFPSFISGSSKETEAEIRKELALKYFGREIDGTAHKDMSNLISDQMKSTTEMVKAATDVLKVKDKA